MGIILCLQGETLIARCSMENTGPETKVRGNPTKLSFQSILCGTKVPTMIVTFRAGHRDVEGPGDVRCLPALQVDLDQVSKTFNIYQR